MFLLVRGEMLDRCNEDNQKLIFELEKKGRVVISWNTSAKEVHDDYLILEKEGKKLRLQNNYLFIFAGAELPFNFLRSIGVMIETKHGGL